MDRQCNALIEHIKCFSCLPLSLSYVLSWIADQLSFGHRLNSSISRIEFQHICFYGTAEVL